MSCGKALQGIIYVLKFIVHSVFAYVKVYRILDE